MDYVYPHHLRCQNTFTELLNQLQGSSHAYAEDFPHHEAANEFDRYKVWAANVGANHSGANFKLSLDYRLREAPFYKDQVIKLLTRLEEVLTRALGLFMNVRKPLENVNDLDIHLEGPRDDTDQTSSASSGSVSDWAISDDDDLELPGKLLHTAPTREKQALLSSSKTELPQLLSSLKLTIASIYKMPVRRPAPVERLDKFSKGRLLDVALYQHFDCLFVEDLFKGANSQLKLRLGRLISRRRQLLQYRKVHNENLKRVQYVDAGEFSEDQHRNVTQESSFQNSNQTQLREESAVPPSYTQSSRNQKSDIATTFKPGASDTIMKGLLEYDVRSEPETLSSWASQETSNEALHIPSRPVDPNGEELEDLECPYCYTLIHVRSQHAWKYDY